MLVVFHFSIHMNFIVFSRIDLILFHSYIYDFLLDMCIKIGFKTHFSDKLQDFQLVGHFRSTK